MVFGIVFGVWSLRIAGTVTRLIGDEPVGILVDWLLTNESGDDASFFSYFSECCILRLFFWLNEAFGKYPFMIAGMLAKEIEKLVILAFKDDAAGGMLLDSMWHLLLLYEF